MVGEKGILYMGMGVSGGEEGARNGAPAGPGVQSSGSPEPRVDGMDLGGACQLSRGL